MADKQTISRYRGDTYPIRIYLKDSSGTALDITGATFKLTVNSDQEPVAITNQQFQVSGSIIGDPTDGIVEFTITPTNSDHLGKYYYDVEMTDASTKIRTVLKGIFHFMQDITKA